MDRVILIPKVYCESLDAYDCAILGLGDDVRVRVDIAIGGLHPTDRRSLIGRRIYCSHIEPYLYLANDATDVTNSGDAARKE